MLEYWPYAARKKTFFFLNNFFFDENGCFKTLKLYPHSIKIQINAYKNIYIYIYEKKIQNNVRVLAVCNTQETFLFFIFLTKTSVFINKFL